MRPVVLVAGTWGWSGGKPGPDCWWCADSAFSAFLVGNGYEHLRADPFFWSTDLEGIPSWQFWRRRPRSLDWQAAGWALRYYVGYDAPPINLVTHSHGLQVALWAAYHGLKVHTLIDVAGPVRGDMAPIAEAAKTNIGRWLHLHSDRSDLIQILGNLFDGRIDLTPVREVDIPGVVNAAWPGVGHTRLLEDPDTFHLWREQGWINYLAYDSPLIDRPPGTVDHHDY